MSHHSDDAMLVASTDSFWEPGNYKRTTKRIEDGHRLCDDLMKLINERAEIEKAYGKSLRTWSKKWNEIIERGPEYGTTEAAWKGALVEAERLCDLHLRVRDNLINDVQTKVKMWQKDNYHKTMMQIREKKDMEDSFKKAQKPWAKVLAKVNKAKADHHNACKNERSAMNQERNAGADSSLSPDQVKKLQDRVQKGKEEVQKTKEKYELAVREINDYNAKYIEDMTVVFNKCQDAERERLAFFKETLFGLHKCLNISVDPALPQIYEEFHHTINNADHEKDLKWWSNNHGINMAMNWPQFEEYSEEFRDISGRGKKGHIPEGNITLINQRSVCEDLPEYNADSKSSKKRNVTGKQNKGGQEKSTDKVQSNNPVSSNGKSENYDDMEEWEEEEDDYQNDALVDNGEPGVPVRALYDYDGAESDELSFKIGEMFEKLEDEDEQGWCKGRKDGHVGLYPANYVELVD